MKYDIPSVSIIMPIYNASRFLHQSIESLLNQTLENIEIVCVNDGSKDDSLAIMREYADEDPRVRIIDKPNGGYGHAMNRGLEFATGDYVGILEPDDYADINELKTLYLSAKKYDCDVVKANYFEHSDKKNTDTFMEVLFEMPYNEITNSIDMRRMLYMRPCIWSALYRRDFLIRNNVKFNETPGASYQDTEFAFKVWVLAERVYFIKDAFLHYRIDNDNSSVNSKGKIFSVCDEFNGIESFLNKKIEWRKMYLPILQTLKYDAYCWNLGRIAENYKKIFRDQMAISFIKADYDGFLDQSLFTEDRWINLQKLISDYKKKE